MKSTQYEVLEDKLTLDKENEYSKQVDELLTVL